MPHRFSPYRPRCRDCEAEAARACRRCDRPLCAGCEPPPGRRCLTCEREWSAHEAVLAGGVGAPRPARFFATHVLAPSIAAGALAFVVLLFGGGSLFGPLLMALALVAAVNLPLLALGPTELAGEIGEARTRARINAARHRFLAARPLGKPARGQEPATTEYRDTLRSRRGGKPQIFRQVRPQPAGGVRNPG